MSGASLSTSTTALSHAQGNVLLAAKPPKEWDPYSPDEDPVQLKLVVLPYLKDPQYKELFGEKLHVSTAMKEVKEVLKL
jgi:hypothetical protein